MDYKIVLPTDFIQATTHESLEWLRKTCANNYYRELDLLYTVDEELMHLIGAEADAANSRKVRRAVDALLARDISKPVPNFLAFYGMLYQFLEETFKDGWIYRKYKDDRFYAEAISSIKYDDGRNVRNSGTKDVSVTLYTRFVSPNVGRESGGYSQNSESYLFSPGETTNRRIENILATAGLSVETEELRLSYETSIAHFKTHIRDGFAEQFHVSGRLYRKPGEYSSSGEEVTDRRAIHDTEASEYFDDVAFVEHPITEEQVPLPLYPVIRVFDLKSHDFYWIHTDYCRPYRYNPDLSKSLVLPDSHRDLLDVLTTDLDAFIGDVIAGKSAGNVILSKGIPGVGKTLTAEVYSELTEKPLYSIHSGSLGTTPESVNKRLTEIFKRSKRWNCVLLLDEADVFVMRRGNDIVLNAIVAEFLRAMEYFDGLLFMTTNRPDDIDDAILSRCAAIIDYHPPVPAAATRIWEVQAKNQKMELDPTLIAKLVDYFPLASGRDIKMLFRLALRVSKARSEPLDLEMFRRCSMFRGIVSKGDVQVHNTP